MQTITDFIANLIATDDTARRGTWQFVVNSVGFALVASTIADLSATRTGTHGNRATVEMSLDDAARVLYAADNFDWNKYASTPDAYGRTPFVTPAQRAAVRKVAENIRDWKA